MALFKRGKKGLWWYEFVVHGRRYRESTKGTSRSLAEKIERKRHREIEAAAGGVEVEQVRPVLFSVAAKDWLDLKQPTWAPKTYVICKSDVAHLKPHFGHRLVTDITDKDVAEYVTWRRSKKAADKTIRNELGTLRGILKKHKRWSIIKDDIRLPRGREDVGQALNVEEEEALTKACATSRSRSLLPAVMLALNTGLRHDEIRLLRWRQVDFENSAIVVGKSKTEHGAGRSVPMNQRALATMQAWAQQFPKRKLQHFVFPSEKVGLSGNDEIPQVFDTDPTKAITSWKVSWTTARTAANVTVRFHDLRHTFCTRLLERGAPFAALATIMGWSPGTAMRMAKRYGHIGKSIQRDAVALLDGLPHQRGERSPSGAASRPNATHESVN